MDELFEQRKKMIAELVHDELYVPMKIKELAIFLNVAKEDRHELERVLDSLVSEGKLTIRDLPAYIRLQMAKKTSLLSPLEKRVLQTVAQNPKTGRAGLQEILENEGIQVAEGKIRSILQSLSEQGLIKVNRTRGGCEITETGELQLE